MPALASAQKAPSDPRSRGLWSAAKLPVRKRRTRSYESVGRKRTLATNVLPTTCCSRCQTATFQWWTESLFPWRRRYVQWRS